MLVMVVADKRTDIAILRTFGASPRAVATVFLTQGLLIGWLGVAAASGSARWWPSNVGPILDFLDRYAGFTVFDADVYYITAVPSELHGLDVSVVALSALIVTTLATPVSGIARVQGLAGRSAALRISHGHARSLRMVGRHAVPEVRPAGAASSPSSPASAWRASPWAWRCCWW